MVARTIKFALAQTCPVAAKEKTALHDDIASADPFPTLRQNLAEVEKYVEEAKGKGADIVVFPEYFLQDILNQGRQYLSLPSVHLESYLCDLAKKYSIGIGGTIVHGRIQGEGIPPIPSSSPFTSESSMKQWHDYLSKHSTAILENVSHIALENEAFLIDAQGEVCGRYVKRNLWHPERDYLSPGSEKGQVFDTPWGKIGFLICWDLSHPILSQHLVEQGADLIIAPTYWLGTDSEPMVSRYNKDPDYELKVVRSLALARSFESELALVMVNAGGPKEKGFMGGSGAWAPLLGNIGGFEDSEVGIKMIDVDLSVLKDARDTYKIREDWSNEEVR